jgi:arylsulfatase A-like enzyme
VTRREISLRLHALAAVLVVAAHLGCGPRKAAEQPRGVILISLDTLRADRLNCYGYRARVVSPEIDRLAGDAVLFENHITASPWTTPSHMSLLTSLNPSAHGVTRSFRELWDRLQSGGDYERLANEHETLAEVLARNGYATAAFTGGATVDPEIGFGRGFSSYDTSMVKLDQKRVARLTSWIEEHGDKPFFVFWHTFEVHAPYLQTDFVRDVVPAERAERLAAALRHVQKVADLPHAATRVARILMNRRLFTQPVVSALYDGGIRSVDRRVGELVQALKDAGLYEHTLLILTADHGEQLGEMPDADGGRARDGRFYDAHGHTLYEEMVRVPLIVKLPGGRHAGRRIAAVSRAIDVMPTILDVLSLPAAPAEMQGASLRPLWEGGKAPLRTAFTEALIGKAESKSIRGERYKYILSFDARQVEKYGRASVPSDPVAVELYDLQKDPGERQNLLKAPSVEITRLAERLDAALRQVAAQGRGAAVPTRLSPEAVERIKALGYVK